MRISRRAFIISLGVQLVFLILFWLTPRGNPGSGLDLLSGFFAFILFSFYLIPIGLIKAMIYGPEPLPSPFAGFIIGLTVLLYATMVGLACGFFRKGRPNRTALPI